MMQKIIDRYKQIKKKQFLEEKYVKKYAFIGIGNHSLNNLYPILQHLRVPLKYIVTKNEATAILINQSYSDIIGTTNLNCVLDDPELTGVFISSKPDSHYFLVKQALNKNLNVFVEKPPCYTNKELEHLILIEKTSKTRVLIGLQKRYAPLYQILKKNLNQVLFYNYEYKVGSYPEGNLLFDLFIHPLDLVCFLFGEPKIKSLIKIPDSKNPTTYLIHLHHKGNIFGSLQLSSNNSWAEATEHMTVYTKKYIFETTNTRQLDRTTKPEHFFGIPIEKIRKTATEKKVLFSQNDFIPTMANNQIYASGYYNEIKTFLDLCEKEKGENISSLNSIRSVYKLFEMINTG